MPKTVDHEQRRALIADALVRLAAREGLHAVTMRAVADEAGVSLRLVQYYFHSKAELLRGALAHLERQSVLRWEARLARLPGPVSARAFVEAFLAEALPSDEASRAFHLVGASYAVLAMTEPDLVAGLSGITGLEKRLAGVLRQARTDGELAVGLDPTIEAARLVALCHGIGTTVLIGQRGIRPARKILRHHVDQLFGTR
ncbi:TetR family transcriptional regulator [Herbihabitans rhizosphaerae]|uniref:TetR family transcriptional regulator n=1 Tax=Herbihabitans rhizosphaerae TaxID=1872711 RepID=A0A4Q7L5H5_9PSEU|nr:TetR family transcriptional regulator C-terminal domain-containing protein [Herbihabitans rhizosphaerae]RZS44577.1 TetR family transcriptional regulator [Herbihabitans rhizosphaerae]